jgi:hypothetical protein
MKKILLSLAAMLLIPLAFAAPPSVTLTWSAPVANSDGSTPPLIGGYNVYVANTDSDLTALPNTLNGGKPISVGNVLTYAFTSVVPGTYFYAVTTWYCSTGHVCVESPQSAHISTTVAAPVIVPGTPTNVQISVSVTAPK